MIKIFDSSNLINKFASLLSNLFHSAKLSLENINETIVTNDFFSFDSEDNINGFITTENAVIAEEIFNARFLFDGADYDPLYWAGQMYLKISFNMQIPLQQIFLLCPLEHMVSHFTIYHEMNDLEMIKEYMTNEHNRSILKLLRDKSSLSIRQLSDLSLIKDVTLRYYEKNSNLFNASNETINTLSNVLGISKCLILRRSSYQPVFDMYFEDDSFKSLLKNNIYDFYKIKNLPFYANALLNEVKDENYVFVGSINMIKNKNRITIIENGIYKALLQKTINEYLKANEFKELVF